MRYREAAVRVLGVPAVLLYGLGIALIPEASRGPLTSLSVFPVAIAALFGGIWPGLVAVLAVGVIDGFLLPFDVFTGRASLGGHAALLPICLGVAWFRHLLLRTRAQAHEIAELREADKSSATRRVAQSEQFTHILGAVGAAASVEDALKALLEGAVTLLGGTQAAARLFDDTGFSFRVIVGADGAMEADAHAREPHPRSFAGEMQAGAPGAVVPDVWSLDPADYPFVDRARKEGLRATLHVPIEVGGRRIGSLHLDHPQPGFYDATALALASALAVQAAGAIERARLEEQDAAERERARKEVMAINARLREALSKLEETQEQVVAQERLRALGEMAAGIAHDLNNALSPVVGFAELLIHGAAETLDRPQLNHYLQLIHTGAQDASQVVRRLREFYRPLDEGDVVAPVDLERLIDQAVSLTQPKWKDQAQALGCNVEVKTTVTPRLLALGHEAHLREALTNLIFNAVDAMPHGGTITLRTRTHLDSVAIDVQDTGTGMTADVRRRCLEPFFSTKGNRGTGLGLAMVHGIVQRQGGRIEIESEVGRGTTITLVLPSASPALVSNAAAQPELRIGRPLRVLVVDDEDTVRLVTEAYLRADGHEVLAAGGGREALEQFHGALSGAATASGGTGPVDVVITDRAMPGMNGEQLALAIKHAAPQVPVILLTGFGDLMDAAEERPPGIDAVLAKPTTMAALRRTLVGLVTRASVDEECGTDRS